MNDWDRNNLNFLLSLNDQEFEQFMAESDDDDIAYALELVQREKTEAILRLEELQDTLLKEAGSNLSEAQAVLAKFRL